MPSLPSHPPRQMVPAYSASPQAVRNGTSGQATLRPQPARHGAAFAVFIVVNALLFVRPSDIFEAMLGVEVYQYAIGLCLLLALPALFELLLSDRLLTTPATICVLCLFPVLAVSSVVNLDTDLAGERIISFAKVMAYFLLLLALVTTPRRLKVFVSFLVFFAGVMAVLSLLDFTQVITLYRMTEVNGRQMLFEKDRLYGPGMFGDPNDFCTILVAMLILALGLMADKRSGSLRVLWLVPAALMAVCFALTQSRGGLLALMAGLGVCIQLRFGWARALSLGALGFPILLLVLGGRQTAISAGTNTGQERIQLWSLALEAFRASPVIGVGPGRFQELNDMDLLAHNSYLQAFAEVGFVGAMFFVGATLLSVWDLYRLTLPGARRAETPVLTDPDLAQLHPYLTGCVLAYCSSMFTLSLNELLSTYTIFGLSAAFLGMAHTRPERVQGRFDLTLLVRLAGIALAALVALYLFVRLTFSA